ncbi:MAG: tRNA (adenosine(37)-N6)-threonylcarbamoyltransferase complex dimerization subunit type 1 TsaB [Chloroflexi bacterium]|nr:tRNA (adenosine(37)-N6)-threonylcarbamoyltransferase complex dimerization subunit type 1 TsaB [Chloroflexota bacterium]
MDALRHGMLLAIDSATQIVSIALHDGDALVAECTLRAGRQHSALLAPMIEETMTRTGLGNEDLTALAVSVGPGSYTGVRIGVALAKGLAAPCNLPLVPVTTLETIVAAQARHHDNLPLAATVPAGRQRVIWAEYRFEGDAWVERRPPQISDWQAILSHYECPIRVSGEVSSAGLETIQLARENGAAIELAPGSHRLRRAGFLAEIAWRRLRAGDRGSFPAGQVRPVYLRGPA